MNCWHTPVMAACVLVMLAIAPDARASTRDTSAVNVDGQSRAAPEVPTGSRLAQILRNVDSGTSIRVDIEVSQPPSHSAELYARRYGIDPALAQLIIDAARDEGLDPELGFRLVRVESVFRRSARGPRGALGLTQLMPSTARAIDRTVRTEAEILEPRTNLRIGFRYLRRMISEFGDVRLGLLAYNRGEGTVRRALRAGRDPENGYSRRVLQFVGGEPYAGPGLLESTDRGG